MNISEAQGIIKPKDNSLEGIKAGYRAACKKYHPDINPDSVEFMKLINLAYEFLIKNISKLNSNFATKQDGPSIDEAIQTIFDKIKTFEGIKAEVCGTWLWLNGNTYQYKDQINEAGLRFSRNKKAWYWHPPGYKKRSRKSFTMPEIRDLWGSYKLDQEPLSQLG